MSHLSGFGLENFRVFKDFTWFDFAPITLFVGPNNSGKSSVIKALLLLKDNWIKQNIPYSEGDIVANHFKPILSFAGIDHNLRSAKDIKNRIIVNGEISFVLPYDLIEYNQERLVSLFNSNLYLHISYKYLAKSEDDYLKPVSVINLFSDEGSILSYQPFNNILEFNVGEFERISKKKCEFYEEFQRVFPESTPEIYNNLIDALDSFKTKKDVIKYPYYNNLKGEVAPDVSEIINILLEYAEIPNHREVSETINKILKINDLSPAFKAISNIAYIPSFKNPPKRYFNTTDSDVINKIISEILVDDNLNGEQSFSDKWSTEFQLSGPIRWKIDRETGIVHLKVGDDYLSNLGVGASQIVALLLANYSTELYKDERLIILEEPETNLHPAFQSKLADMFVDAYNAFRRQFIIETHSEYLIRKLQYLIAKGEAKPEDVVIYYFHDPNNIPPGEKQVKKITILEDGSLSDEFGPGFFDEAANWELELLKLKKNKNRQN